MPAFQWARMKVNVKSALRLGAWYRILKLSASEVVLDVKGKPVPLPRGQLQLSPTRVALDRCARAPQRATLPERLG